jgi:hypothetical protein
VRRAIVPALIFLLACTPLLFRFVFSEPVRAAHSSRFSVEEEIEMSGWSYPMKIVKDNSTGQRYLVNYHGGIIEIREKSIDIKAVEK